MKTITRHGLRFIFIRQAGGYHYNVWDGPTHVTFGWVRGTQSEAFAEALKDPRVAKIVAEVEEA